MYCKIAEVVFSCEFKRPNVKKAIIEPFKWPVAMPILPIFIGTKERFYIRKKFNSHRVNNNNNNNNNNFIKLLKKAFQLSLQCQISKT